MVYTFWMDLPLYCMCCGPRSPRTIRSCSQGPHILHGSATDLACVPTTPRTISSCSQDILELLAHVVEVL